VPNNYRSKRFDELLQKIEYGLRNIYSVILIYRL